MSHKDTRGCQVGLLPPSSPLVPGWDVEAAFALVDHLVTTPTPPHPLPSPIPPPSPCLILFGCKQPLFCHYVRCLESVVSSQFSVANQKEPVSRKRPTPNMPRRGVAEGELERCCVVKSGETWGRRLGAAAQAAPPAAPARPDRRAARCCPSQGQ